MSNSKEVPIITINIPYLYHTTPFYTKDQDDEYTNLMAEKGVTLKPNSYIPHHSGEKYFTVSPYASYGSDTCAYLKYTVKGSLKLADFRGYEKYCPFKMIPILKYKLDGYIAYEDFTEIYLLHNEKHISDVYQQMDYSPSPYTNRLDFYLKYNIPFSWSEIRLKEFNYKEALDLENVYISKVDNKYIPKISYKNYKHPSKKGVIYDLYETGLPKTSQLNNEIQEWLKYVKPSKLSKLIRMFY